MKGLKNASGFRAYLYLRMPTRAHTYICACLYSCTPVWVHTYMCAHVCSCVQIYAHDGVSCAAILASLMLAVAFFPPPGRGGQNILEPQTTRYETRTHASPHPPTNSKNEILPLPRKGSTPHPTCSPKISKANASPLRWLHPPHNPRKHLSNKTVFPPVADLLSLGFLHRAIWLVPTCVAQG